MAFVTIGAVLVFAAVLCVLEVPRLLQKRWYRELWAFSILLGSGVILAILLSLGVPIPSIPELIALIFGPLMKGIKK